MSPTASSSTSLLDRVPGQIDLIQSLATVLAVLCWFPLLWAAWSILAGAIDSVATRVRIGLVVRTRRPSDVVPYSNILNPFADRDRFSTYLAVDDGRRASVVAWLATERTSAPQGAQARVRATPLLGFVAVVRTGRHGDAGRRLTLSRAGDRRRRARTATSWPS